jgi:cell division protein FtsZ
MIDFAYEEQPTVIPSIKVIGVGGAGGNTVNSLVEAGCNNIHCIVANTDAQSLEQSCAHEKIQLGVKATKGLGAGANPDIGKHAAEEDIDKIMGSLGSADIVFLTAGMGGGTGSGALPVIAHALKEEDILTIAIVTTPFAFEGKRRLVVAQQAIAKLEAEVDALIVVPNQRLLEIVGQEASLLDAFAMINTMLSQAVKGIADIITKPGYINVDFADLKAIMKGMGFAIMGTGRASGANRASEAAKQAINSPLLENMDINGARGVLLNITGGPSMRLHEINEAASIVYEQAADDAHIIVGTVIDKTLSEDIIVSIIATGFGKRTQQKESASNVHGATRESNAIEVAVPNGHNRQEIQAAQKTQDEQLTAVKVQPALQHNEAGDELDIPTFIRKQSEEHV